MYVIIYAFCKLWKTCIDFADTARLVLVGTCSCKLWKFRRSCHLLYIKDKLDFNIKVKVSCPSLGTIKRYARSLAEKYIQSCHFK